jgi:hypothetical protein
VVISRPFNADFYVPHPEGSASELLICSPHCSEGGRENVIRGGATAWGPDANNRPRRVTARAINGIDQDIKLNKALWTLAERMAAIKKAA